jgi:uncharacterized repeat protein (TIGR02543 family)
MFRAQHGAIFRTRRDKVGAIARLAIVVSLFIASLPLFLVSSASAAGFETVTFAQNDNSSDSVSATQTTEGSTALTLFADITPAFSNPGHTFVDWNTQADGTGTPYSNGEIYNFAGPILLYAIWSGPDETVTFAENDSPSDSVETTQTGNTTTALTTFSSLNPQFSDAGYTFAGWNTEANGSGSSYTNGEDYSFSAAIVLWAQWIPLPSLTITFNDNGAVGNDSPLTDPSGTSISLPSGTGLSLAGYTFTGWNTESDGLGAEYAPGQSLDVSSSETLYAQWTPVTSSSTSPSSSPSTPPPNLTSTSTTAVTVSFVANGGSGSLAIIDEASGANVTLPSASSVVRVGFTLTSWNTEADGKGTSYKPGASVGLATSVTLYAQWTSTGAAPAVLYGAIGEFAKNSTTLSTSLKHQVRELATVMKEKHYTKVKLYGYSAATGLATLDRTLSDARASRVASYLRVELNSMKVTGVSVEAAGEGSFAGKASSLYSRVEVFVS